MIEAEEARGLLVEAITRGRADQRRGRLHAQLLQERQQKHRLALAVAEAARPRLIGFGRHIPAVVGSNVEIADLVLNQLQRREGANLGIARTCCDRGRLGLDRRGRLQGLGVLEQGRDRARDVLPASVAGRVETSAPGKARWRAGRRRGGLQIGGVQQQGRPAVPAFDLGLRQALRRAPMHRVGTGPRDPHPISSGDSGRTQAFRILGPALGRRIAFRDRPGHVQNVADLQPVELARRGQASVKHARFEARLPAQDQHL